MPRAKIKTAEPIVTTRPFSFTPAIKDELIDLLGYDLFDSEQTSRAHKAIALAEQAAANYLGAVELVPNLPGPAHIHAEIKAFYRKGDFRDEAWQGLHLWTRQQLSRLGDFGALPPGNAKAIASAVEQYLHSYKVKPTGRPRQQARARLIKELCRIFQGYGAREAITDGLLNEDCPGLTKRSRRGAVSSYSALEQDRYEFVCTVFRALDIPVYKDLHEDIVIQATTPHEYARRLDIIASRSRRRRKKQQQVGQPDDRMYLFPDG